MTQRLRSWIALVACAQLLAASCARSRAVVATASDAAPRDLRALDDAWLIRPYRTHDMAAYDRIVDDAFRIRHGNGRLLTKAEKRADVLASPLVEPDAPFALGPVETRIVGDVAITTGTITERAADVYYTNTYVRRDGEWRVVASQLTRIRRE